MVSEAISAIAFTMRFPRLLRRAAHFFTTAPLPVTIDSAAFSMICDQSSSSHAEIAVEMRWRRMRFRWNTGGWLESFGVGRLDDPATMRAMKDGRRCAVDSWVLIV